MSKREDNFKNFSNELGNFAENLNFDSDESEEDNDHIARIQLKESFEIGDIIAEGGLKTVRKAVENKTGREIAIAQLKKEHRTLINTERFIREAKTLANLEHTNIVPIYDINHNEELGLYFSMKLLTGETLTSIIKKIKSTNEDYVKKYPLQKRLNIFNRVCDAVIYAHSKQVAHLDLKPDNIQISEYGEVSVLDWGMAKQLNSDSLKDYEFEPTESELDSSSVHLTQAGVISGTPGYMSPEQINKDSVPGTASDIYSLGATLYMIVFQRHPYEGESKLDIISKTQNGDSPKIPVKIHGNAIPSALRAIIQKCMSLKPEDRYESVIDLQKDIELYLSDFLTQAEEISLMNLSKLFLKRHFTKVAVSIAVLLTFSILLFFSYSEIKEQKELKNAEILKIDQSKDTIISGIKKKNEQLHKTFSYTELLKNYEELERLNLEYPEFWFDHAMLHIGDLNFERALHYLDKIAASKSTIIHKVEFKNALKETKAIYTVSLGRDLSNKEIINFILKMPPITRNQIFWNINQDPAKSIEEKFDFLLDAILRFNRNLSPDSINFRYNIKDEYISLDLSNNPKLTQGRPLLGLPIDELNLSNTQINIGTISRFFKNRLTKLNISNNPSFIYNFTTEGQSFTTLIAKNCAYSAPDLNNLKHLDLEGANIIAKTFVANNSLEHLNIAHSEFKNLEALENLRVLKTLKIDSSMPLSQGTRQRLESRGVKIITLE